MSSNIFHNFLSAGGADLPVPAKIAARTGRPHMSAQAVGGAVGHNPISLIIPCHRVVGTNGSLTGYAGGLDKKERLLEMEKGLPGGKF